MTTQEHDRVLILDFGSQFTQLIARRIREESVYSEIHPPTRSLDWIRAWNPTAVILSGGPNSVYDDGVPKVDPELLALGFPILGICYGMQLLMHHFGSKVSQSSVREYGHMQIKSKTTNNLFKQVNRETSVWMSHGDKISSFDDKWDILIFFINISV